jgi:4-hydroxy-tetrahydrodipicolinate synthase
MGIFAGAWTALITPFRNDAVDERALRDLVEDQIQQGIDGLVPCGTTGESVSLSHEEYAKVVTITVEQAKGRVPVVAGAGSASTRHTIELGQTARSARADGVLVITPYYNRPTQDGLFAHFEAVTKAVQLPLMLYNLPARTGVDLAFSTLERLAEIPSIVAVKEATGNVLRSSEILSKLGDRFSVLSGDDALTLPILALGGHGVVSVVSNLVPGDVARLVQRGRAGDFAAARAIHQRLQSLGEVLFVESNPGPVKAALAICGRIAPEIRLPLVLPSEPVQARIRAALQATGLL